MGDEYIFSNSANSHTKKYWVTSVDIIGFPTHPVNTIFCTPSNVDVKLNI